jgi:hypothetical protein
MTVSDDKPHLSKSTVLIGVFGALWGLMEISLGTLLKGLRVPMSGAILTSVAAMIFLTGRYFIHRKFSILIMGGIAATIKVFSVGTVIAGPFMAILIEAGIAELLISFLGINRLSYMLTSTVLVIYTIIHPFISQGIIFGANIYKIYLGTFHKLADVLHAGYQYLAIIIFLYILIHALLGAASGWIAYSLAKRVENEYNNLLQQPEKL